MTALHVTFSLLCAMAGFAAGSHAALAQYSLVHDELVPPGTISFEWEADAPGQRTRGQIDLRGNSIDHAVSDYRIDPLGGTCETHAPDTAVARPGPAGV